MEAHFCKLKICEIKTFKLGLKIDITRLKKVIIMINSQNYHLRSYNYGIQVIIMR